MVRRILVIIGGLSRIGYSFDEACFSPVAISREKTPRVFNMASLGGAVF